MKSWLFFDDFDAVAPHQVVAVVFVTTNARCFQAKDHILVDKFFVDGKTLKSSFMSRRAV